MTMSMRVPAWLAGAGLLVLQAAAAAEAWVRIDEVGDAPIVRTTEQAYPLSAHGVVEIRNIGGSVEVLAGAPGRVSFRYERRAASEQDLACETLHQEHGPDRVALRVETLRRRECHVVRATDRLSVTVPASAALTVEQVGDTLRISGVQGFVRVRDVGDSLHGAGLRELDAESIGDSVQLSVAQPGSGGIRIDSVGDRVDLTLPRAVDARLTIESVGDAIHAADFGVARGDEDGNVEARLGRGGPWIRIDSVGDEVRLRAQGGGRAIASY